MAIRNTILIFVLMGVLFATASASTISSTFTCKSNDDNSTMTFYSYLKEPKLEESGYTRGYKTGSFNYLVDGNIDFEDSIKYYDGLIDGTHGSEDDLNSTVDHRQEVHFNGTKGISEFYAKGFFPNNRAISAWKKIRYDDLTYNFSKLPDRSYGIITLGKSSQSRLERTPAVRYAYAYEDEPEGSSPTVSSYGLGESYSSSKIDVNASAKMGPESQTGADGEYDFKYSAKVTDGVIEIKDATAWTNRTVSNRIDWEQDAMIKGDVDITNNLVSEGLFFPAAGGDIDWLPCCFDGSNPPIVNREYPEVKKPDKILPQNCSGTSCDCNNGSCPGGECIYTYAEGEPITSTRARATKPIVQVDTITVTKTLQQPPDNYDNYSRFVYRIEVNHNSADTLKNITVVDEMPPGLSYYSSEVDYGTGQREELRAAKTGDSITGENLKWEIKDLEEGKAAYIYVTAEIADNTVVNETTLLENSAFARGVFEKETQMVEVTSEEVTTSLAPDVEYSDD